MESFMKEMRMLRESNSRSYHFIASSMSAPLPLRSSSVQIRDDEKYLQYQRGLINLHRTTGIPPTIKRLDGEVTKLHDQAIAGGTYSDIWLGMWLGEEKVNLYRDAMLVDDQHVIQVALKALRNIKASDPKAQTVRFSNQAV
jgi:hypothetical protein